MMKRMNVMKKRDQVSGNTEVKIVSVVPHFELATIANYQRLKRHNPMYIYICTYMHKCRY